MLEAVAAAALVHELALEVGEPSDTGTPAMGIEVLERDRGDVGAVQLGQPGARADPDPVQIAV